ncbi:MAG: tRNA uridine-5-carboxymethylaminomethyl(34) synthesis enzyme MnmG [Ignavibacteria bacterium GWF2_33_9]|nr:MAG: tRNA uridine-5-carboxymethylaminomethyl(34) synthesis enzyme MnmG [Ignavibacteria bacterium GWF2_33_9]
MAENKRNNYDIIVIGGGHAGIEASYISNKMGMNVALITMNKNTIGAPSCNPSIGGTAKGHLVKEIDALGGIMPRIADDAGIQFKILNISKGPAVWSPRAQIDKDLYPVVALNYLLKEEKLTIIEETIDELLLVSGRVAGVVLKSGETIHSKAVIITAGTFLRGVMWTGLESNKGGRFGEPSADKLSIQLKDAGFQLDRLKTGTPPRVHKDSIDYTKLKLHPGDDKPAPFSIHTESVINQVMCYATDTNLQVHSILQEGFEASPMFTGLIGGTGPRYCPSIEDKVNRFSDKSSHKIVLEPEGLNTDSVYVNGFSTSLPKETQLKGLHKIKGLENSEIIRFGYAIEYDFFNPYQLKLTLETKNIEGLYYAGQINGTSGYEEAAAQGLMAGINAALQIRNSEPFILKRNEAYIGVMIDDLVNKEHQEPYRVFTSLAEYRLLLRVDNVYDRLSEYAFKFGTINLETYEHLRLKRDYRELAILHSKNTKLKPAAVNPYLSEIGESEIIDTSDVYSLTKRGPVKLSELLKFVENNELFDNIKLDEELINNIQIDIKYEGYIQRQLKEVDYFLQNENKVIPENFDYGKLQSLSTEALNKLSKIRPGSLGQASRIQGISATDISILSLFLRGG